MAEVIDIGPDIWRSGVRFSPLVNVTVGANEAGQSPAYERARIKTDQWVFGARVSGGHEYVLDGTYSGTLDVMLEDSPDAAAWTTVATLSFSYADTQLFYNGGTTNLDDYFRLSWQGQASNPNFLIAEAGISTMQLEQPLTTSEIFTGSGTWTKPPGLVAAFVTVIGAGGGGGNGQTAAAGNDRGGGSGGGGGAYHEKMIHASDLGATETVTVGGSSAAEVGGAKSSFGTLLEAYGGGAGKRGVATLITGGGGGGWYGAGAAGSSVINPSPGGAPIGGVNGGADSPRSNDGDDAHYGGGAGAPNGDLPTGEAGYKGGGAAFGGGGGGGGGNVDVGNVEWAGGAGGRSGFWTAGGGGTAGAANGGAGGDGSDGTASKAGDGGGGGGGDNDPTPGAGGNGGVPAGGGGGGGAGTTGAAGGTGGRGEVRVINFF